MGPGSSFEPVFLPWRGGGLFFPPPRPGDACASDDMVMRALSQPGDLAPAASPPAWSFHAGFPHAATPPYAKVLSSGFRLSSDAEGGPAFTCMGLSPGVYAGSSSLAARPALFSAVHPVDRGSDVDVLETTTHSILLARLKQNSLLRFALVITEDPPERARATAVAALAADADQLFDAECRQRHAFWSAVESRPAGSLAAHACESLHARLRPPSGAIPCVWSAADASATPSLNLNDVFPLTAAWCRIDPAIAESIVRSALACLGPDGLAPAARDVAGPAIPGPAAWPMLAQAAWLAWTARRDAAFLRHIRPPLQKYIERTLAYYDAEGAGRPAWRSAEESFVPAAFENGLSTPDLTAFLLAEIHAWFALCSEAPAHDIRREPMDAARERLEAHLLEYLWDPASGTFTARYAGGRRTERVSISSIMPLLCEPLPASVRENLLRLLGNPAALDDPLGVPLWARWGDDADDPPIPCAHQVLVLEGLRRAGARSELSRLARRLADGMSVRYESTERLPADLRPGGSAGNTQDTAQDSAPAAALTILLATGVGEAGHSGALSPGLQRLDRQRAPLLTGAVAMLVLSVLATVLAFSYKKELPIPSLDVMSGLAQQYYREGDYEAAIRVSREFLRGARAPAPAVELVLGNAHLRRGELAEAERRYRAVLEKAPTSQQALMNLGLTLYRQGRPREAETCYRDFIRQHGAQRPDLAERARTALAIILEGKPAPRMDNLEGTASRKE